jgi:hypothetical protein
VFPSDWTAYIGISEQSENGHKSSIIAIIQPHPMWDAESYRHDVAIFKLGTSVTYSGKINNLDIKPYR